MHEKYQYYDGKKFTRDDRTGYYLCAEKAADGKRKRMHVYVWESHNGPVPKGYHIHHIDEDKSNNDITNLEMLTATQHLSMHGREQFKNNRKRILENLRNNAVPEATKWHESVEGREWHKKHYEHMKEKLYKKYQFTCQFCGTEFTSTRTGSKYCSNRCRAAARRASGVDDVVKICDDCGGEYIANKYAGTKYCSVCKHKKHPRNRKRRCL